MAWYNPVEAANTTSSWTAVGAVAPPSGITPDFENPTSRAGRLLAANVACLVIATIFVVLRLYTNIFLVRVIGWDDYCTILSLIMSVAFSVTSMLLCRAGLGVHLWNIPLGEYSPEWLRVHMVLTAMYPILIFLVKTSILLLYIRVLGTCVRTRRGAYGLIAFVFAYCFAAFLATIFACTPRKKIWDVGVQEGRCIDGKELVIAVAALNVVSDVLILTLPMPLVWYFLRIPRRQKMALTAVFMTGSFVCIVSMVRLKQVVHVRKSDDVSWAELDPTIWTVVEVNVGIAVVCMPTLKLLVRKIFPQALEDTVPSHRLDPNYGRSEGSMATTMTISLKSQKSRGHTRMEDDIEMARGLRAAEPQVPEVPVTPQSPPPVKQSDGSRLNLSDLSGYLHQAD